MAATMAPWPESTLTDRYQTTIPDSVRKALGLNKRDKICYNIQPDGKVWISRADGTEENDLVLGKFLNFLAQDMEQNPQHIQAISSNLVNHVQYLYSDRSKPNPLTQPGGSGVMGCGMLTGVGLLQQPYGCNGGILPTFKVNASVRL